MKETDLSKAIEKAQEIGSYFVTLTIKDKNKEEGDLSHYAFRKEFPIDDIVPSIDAAIRSMKITPERPVEVTKAPEVTDVKKKLKIAIISHFNRAPDSYSPGKAVRNQIKLLREYGHEVSFFVQEGSPLDLDCDMKKVMPKFKREKNVVNEEGKKLIIDVLREHLTSDYDVAITHDFYIDDCITYREAIKECGVPIKWLHWARSGIGHPIDFKMDNANYVYMNYADVGHFARNINVDSDKVRVVFNEKDPSFLFDWNPITKMVCDKMKLWDKDIVQVYPMCTTRMSAKGIDSVIKTFGELKKLGMKVALVICNSNGRKRLDEINSKIKFAMENGLSEEDFVFTSTLANDEYKIESEVPHKVVAELLQISNLFIFPTIAEVCSNVLLEASMTKNLIVINEDLPLLYDFVDKDSVLSYPFISNKSLHYSGKDELSLGRLAKQIEGQIRSNKADRQFRRIFRIHNRESIYKNMLEPILREGLDK